MANKNPFEFLQQVRNEAVKVTWPTRQETLMTTLMVFVLSAIAAIFFLFTDFTIQKVLGLLLSLGQ
jgi:preprotein translocase subunit SecE